MMKIQKIKATYGGIAILLLGVSSTLHSQENGLPNSSSDDEAGMRRSVGQSDQDHSSIRTLDDVRRLTQASPPADSDASDAKQNNSKLSSRRSSDPFGGDDPFWGDATGEPFGSDDPFGGPPLADPFGRKMGLGNDSRTARSVPKRAPLQAIRNRINLHQLELAKPNANQAKIRKELEQALREYFLRDMQIRVSELDEIKAKVAETEASLKRRLADQDEAIELQMKLILRQADGLGFFQRTSRAGSAKNQ